MNPITLTYAPKPEEHAEAALLFLYQRSIMRFSVMVMRAITVAITLILISLATQNMLEKQHIAVFGLTLLFVFGHSRFNRFVLRKRFLNQGKNAPAIALTFHDNGIKAALNKQPATLIEWTYIQRVKKFSAGWVLCFKGRQFLFVPYTAFQNENDQHTIETLFQEKKINLS